MSIVRVRKAVQRLEAKYGTQRKVAEALDMTEGWYNKIRNEKVAPPEKTLRLMELMGR